MGGADDQWVIPGQLGAVKIVCFTPTDTTAAALLPSLVSDAWWEELIKGSFQDNWALAAKTPSNAKGRMAAKKTGLQAWEQLTKGEGYASEVGREGWDRVEGWEGGDFLVEGLGAADEWGGLRIGGGVAGMGSSRLQAWQQLMSGEGYASEVGWEGWGRQGFRPGSR